MTRANPDRVIQFAVKLARINELDRKAFNKAMRVKFPRITDRTLYNARLDAKILLAIERISRQKEDSDA